MVTTCVFLGLTVFVTSGLAHFPLFPLPGAYPGFGNEQQGHGSGENTLSTNEKPATGSTGSQQGSSAGNPQLSNLLAYYSGNFGNYPDYGKFYSFGHSGSASNLRQKQFVDFYPQYQRLGKVLPGYKTLGSSYRPFSPYNYYSTRRFIYPGNINDVSRNPFASEEIITINVNLPGTQCQDKDVKVTKTNNKITNIEKEAANNNNNNNKNSQIEIIHNQENQNQQNDDDKAQKRLIAEKQKLKAKLQELQKQHNLKEQQQTEHNPHQPENNPHHGHFQRTSIKQDSQSKKSSEENEESKKLKFSHQEKNGDNGRIEKDQLSKDQREKSQKSEEYNKEQLEKHKLQVNN